MNAKKNSRSWLLALATAIASLSFASTPALAAPVAGPDSATTGRNSIGQELTPAGDLTEVGDLPLNEVVSPDGKYLIVSNNGQGTQSLQVIELATKKVVQTLTYKSPESLYMGLAISPDGKHLFASAAANAKIRTYYFDCGKLVETNPILLPTKGPKGGSITMYPAGLAVTRDSKRLVVADQLADAVSVIDLATNTVDTAPVGHRPVWVTLSKDSRTAYVSSQGGSDVAEVDISGAHPVATHKIDVGFHPNKSVLSHDGKRLYVANGDADTISVVNLAPHKTIKTISVNAEKTSLVGANPTGLAIARDNKTLYVTNSGHNEVAVINAANGKVKGTIPTGWYPTQVLLHCDKLLVTSAKGLGAGPNNGLHHPDPTNPGPVAEDQYSGSMMKGIVTQIAVPNAKTLARYTAQVKANNTPAATASNTVVPNAVGQDSKIKHVIYVVRENRTFDQELGSNGRGNADPALNLFGDESAPNTRKLARVFVTFDNFYADAEVSANGWNWVTQANSNPYAEQMWPSNYSGRKGPYPSESNDPENRAQVGDSYFWEHLASNNVSFRNYGFFTKHAADGQNHAQDTEVLDPNTNHDFIGWDLNCPESADSFAPLTGNCGPKPTVEVWKDEFNQMVATNSVPQVQLVRFGNDHTQATKVGKPTPQAYVADNDQALGQLVETVSHSPIWKDTAIFVTEDDSQNGPDHVDSHRTIGLVISPYTRTGMVDSNFYSTVSMLHTMELIVGVGPLTQFDSYSTPMNAAFSASPDLSPYTALRPSYDMTLKNGANAPLAAQVATQDLSQEDAIDEQLFNTAIWKAVRGADAVMPAPVANVIQSGVQVDEDDDEADAPDPGVYSAASDGVGVWRPDVSAGNLFDPSAGVNSCPVTSTDAGRGAGRGNGRGHAHGHAAEHGHAHIHGHGNGNA